MSCKACGKQLEGAQWDLGLCSGCGSISSVYLEIAKTQNEEQEGSRQGQPCLKRFFAFRDKYNLQESWADGLGLMDSEDRYEYMMDAAWDRYCDYLSAGIGHERALRRATGVAMRGNQKYAVAGQWMPSTMDGAADSSTTMEDYLGQESHSWDNIWTDDL